MYLGVNNPIGNMPKWQKSLFECMKYVGLSPFLTDVSHSPLPEFFSRGACACDSSRILLCTVEASIDFKVVHFKITPMFLCTQVHHPYAKPSVVMELFSNILEDERSSVDLTSVDLRVVSHLPLVEDFLLTIP